MSLSRFKVAAIGMLLAFGVELPLSPVKQLAFADQNEFCAGFEEGYRSIAGSIVIVPICPIAPITPIGSTDFREGIKAGIRAACKKYPDKCR